MKWMSRRIERSESPRQSPLVEAFSQSVLGALGASVLLSGADSLLVGARGLGLLQSCLYLGVAVAATAWIGAAYGALSVPIRLVLGARGSGVWAQFIQIFLALTVLAGVCLLLLKPWEMLESWPYGAAPVGALGGAALVLAVERRFTSARGYFYLCLGGAFFLADALVFRRLYLGLHAILFVLALVSVSRFVELWAPPRGRLRAAAFVVVGVSHLALAADLGAVRHAARRDGAVLPKALHFVHALTDRDFDGHSALFGGGDCDDSDASVHPGACARAADRDENCNGRIGIAKAAPARPPESARPPGEVLPDIYLVMVDTLRGDFGGRPRAVAMPELERFAGKSWDFRQTVTPYPSTFRAMLATCQSRSWRSVEPGAPHLLPWLVERGYSAELWIGERRLVQKPGAPLVRWDRTLGDPFHVDGSERKALWSDELVSRALEEQPSGEPRFRWLHLLDPHAPLVLGDGPAKARYRAAVEHVDQVFGRLMRGLEKTERGRGAVVIFLSDHGEEFGDHGARFHGATLYQENVAVPLVIRFPGVAPRQIETPASLIDIWPTLSDYLGQTWIEGWEGESFFRDVPSSRLVFSQIEPVSGLGGQGRPELHAVIGLGHKFIWDISGNTLELFDLSRDPHERTNLAVQGSRSSEAQNAMTRLSGALAQWQDRPACQSF